MKSAPTIEIEASRIVLVLRTLAGLAGTVLFVLVACHAFPAMDDVLDLMIGGVGCAACVVWTAVSAWRLATMRGPIVTIAPHGIRDRRIAGEMVPWSAVKRVSTREDYRWKAMVLLIDPHVERGLTRTWLSRMTRDADRRRGADGFCVTALGLRTSHETLLATTLAYLEAWHAARRS